MSNRIKIDPLIKVKLVESYLRSEIGLREAARQAGLAGSGTDSFMKWVNIYKNEGPAGLLPQKHSKSYPLTTKLAAVNDYLEGKGSQLEIAARYGLRSKHQLSNWLKEYNTHGEIRSHGSGGGSYMRKARQTTPEERLEIVRACLANDKNYGAMALKYNCSYQQVRNWVMRYEKMGSAGLEDRRGKRAGTQPARTPEEEQRDRIAELERKIRDLTRHLYKYQAIKELSEEKHYPVQRLCEHLHLSRGAYYRWLRNPVSLSEKRNQEISEKVSAIHESHPDMGYRRIRDELEKHQGIDVNDKRILRICRKKHIQSAIKWKPKSCTKSSDDPAHIAKNYLNRDFHADAPNKKWLTDVTEFRYYIGTDVHKVYLSAILDLYDRRIVAYKISDHNDNPLVMNTFDEAVALEPDAHPLFHSDRGFQYTGKQFCTRLKKHHMKQSMSRVAHCIDNGPMEGFWGILKREMYYGRKFTSKGDLTTAVESYIRYYNTERIQRKLHLMTPTEFHDHFDAAA